MGMHAWLEVADTTVEDANRWLAWKNFFQYIDERDSERAFAEAFQEAIKGSHEKIDPCGPKIQSGDFHEFPTQVITQQTITDLANLANALGYGYEAVELAQRNLGKVIWSDFD